MIHPTAIIHWRAYIDPEAEVGPYCVIGSEHGALYIRPGSIIRSHSIIEGGSEYGENLETGHHVLLRSGTVVGKNLRIGSYSSLEGGSVIGDYVRIHGRCEMTGGELRDFSRIYGGCYITDQRQPPALHGTANPCVVHPFAVVLMGCILVAGVEIGEAAYISAQTVVSEDVPDGMFLARDGRLKPNRNHWWKDEEIIKNEYPEEAWWRIRSLIDASLFLSGS